MDVQVYKKFSKLLKDGKIVPVDDEKGLRIDYTLNSRQIKSFLKTANRSTSNATLTDDFESLIQDIISSLSQFASENQVTKPSSTDT